MNIFNKSNKATSLTCITIKHKVLNLEQLGVQEMNMQETKETDGGFLEMILGILIATVIMDGFTAGLNDKT
ncbi:MAG: hypothetical protein ABFS35_20865, partial [Bacteroidota bacterium]